MLLRLNTSNSVIRPNTWTSIGTWLTYLYCLHFWPYFDLAEGHFSSGAAKALFKTVSWTLLRIQHAVRSVCHISHVLITCARQAVSEHFTEVFPGLQTQLRRFRHGRFSSCGVEPQMPSACLKWIWAGVLMAWTVAGEEDQSKSFNAQPKISLTVNILASGCKKSEGHGDLPGLAQWVKRKVMEDFWPDSICPPGDSISLNFLQSAYTQVLRECWSRLVWRVLETSFWKFGFLKYDVFVKQFKLYDQNFGAVLGTHNTHTREEKLESQILSIHLSFSRAGKTGEPGATCSSLYYTSLHDSASGMTLFRVVCRGGWSSLLYCSLPPGVAELLSLASTNITASPPAADPRPPQLSPRPVSHHLAKTAKYCRRNSGCWYLVFTQTPLLQIASLAKCLNELIPKAFMDLMETIAATLAIFEMQIRQYLHTLPSGQSKDCSFFFRV